MSDLFEREMALEEEMVSLGAKRFWDNIQRQKEGHQESQTVYGAALTKEAIIPMRDAIKGFLDDAATKRGKKHVATKYLQMIHPEVSAFIAVRVVLDSITVHHAIQSTAIAIGTALEDEVRFQVFDKENHAFFDKVSKDVDKRGYSADRKRAVLVHEMQKGAKKQVSLEWTPWDRTEKFHLGYKCIDFLVQSTSLIEVVTTHPSKNHSMTYVEATAKTMEWISGKTAQCELLSPTFLPTIIPPKPWTNPFDGGYHSKVVKPLRMVKTRHKNYLEELYHRAESMPLVYEAINAVQATPWRVNARVFGVMQQVWECGFEAGDLPSQQDIPLPPKPADIDTNKESRVLWKREAAKTYTKNIKLRSRRMQQVKLMWLAEKFQKESAIYFPHQLDFRGRLYAVPSYLNPQGSDMAKALLEFAEGKPVGETGLYWLMIHAANSYGADKCSLADRVKWSEDHLKAIIAVALNPMTERWWTSADKPWQFLAVCLEIQAAMINPNYVSHLPVSVDGTCNGLQNFSAMLRDEVGGAATNLLPSQLPQDIYARVAEVTRLKVEAEAQAGDAMAQGWLSFGFDRKATKRPVMVLPYGGTLYSARQYLIEYIEDRVGKNEVAPWGDRYFIAASYLSKHVWKSIGEVVVAARAAMDWLQVTASLAASEELPVNWTTPVGFPVLQAYPNMKLREVRTMLGQRTVKHLLQEEMDTLDRGRQSSGIAPNFVHSMDAACLMLSVHRCRAAGIHSFAMVHDSYGTHAADMTAMSVCLREAFVEMYQQDVLEAFRNSIAAGLSEKTLEKLPLVPAKGNLDLELVKQSVYFFA